MGEKKREKKFEALSKQQTFKNMLLEIKMQEALFLVYGY
jgi:hypothetical protein